MNDIEQLVEHIYRLGVNHGEGRELYPEDELVVSDLPEAKQKLLAMKARWEREAEERMGEAIIARQRQSNYQWEKTESFIHSYELQKSEDVHGIFNQLKAKGDSNEC